MRTTVNLDEDLLLAIQDRARRERRTMSAVLSDLAREALMGRNLDSSSRTGGVGGFVPLPHRGALSSNALIDSIREEEGI